MKRSLYVPLFVFMIFAVPCAAQNFPVTPEWKVSRSVDKMTDEVSCILSSPVSQPADKPTQGKKDLPLVSLLLINGKWHILSRPKPTIAYRNVLIRAGENKAIEFNILRSDLSAELEDKGKSALLISQLKASKIILLRLAISVDEIYDLKISSTFFNEGYVEYQKCLPKKK